MFYDRFIELCNKHGVKPTPLVVGMGLSSSNVSQWKKGSTPRPEVIKRLADYFGVPVAYLAYGEENKKDPAPTEEGGWKQETIRLLEALPPEEFEREMAYLREREAINKSR